MNFSFSEAVNQAKQVPVTSYLYRDIAAPVSNHVKEPRPPQSAAQPENQPPAAPTLSVQQSNELVARARAEAVAETERRLKQEYEAKLEKEAAKIRQAIELFHVEQKSYFSRVESDVVQLSLAIASKILHREAQVDPLLVAALVRVAVDKLHDGSSVSLRISPVKAEQWRERMASPLNGSTILLVEDAHLDPEDCILETELGSANFSIDAQLKEIERGFFDLLAQRPAAK